MSSYVCLDKKDIPGCLRLHAQEMSDGTRKRALATVVIDFVREGPPDLVIFGTDCTDPRENLHLLNEAQQRISRAIARFNAMASN